MSPFLPGEGERGAGLGDTVSLFASSAGLISCANVALCHRIRWDEVSVEITPDDPKFDGALFRAHHRLCRPSPRYVKPRKLAILNKRFHPRGLFGRQRPLRSSEELP